jgi:hypothetical protein
VGDGSALPLALSRLRRSQATTFLCDGWAPSAASELLRHLLPGECAVASVDAVPSLCGAERSRIAVLGPELWLLERPEVEGCVGASSVQPTDLDRLFELTGGWLRPIELALESGAFDRSTVLESETVRRFLVDRARSSLLPVELRRVQALASGGATSDGAGPNPGTDDRVAAFAQPRRAVLLLAAALSQSAARSAGAPPPTSRSHDVRLLGVPEVVPAGERNPLQWPYRRVVALLGLLALDREHGAAQDRVFEALWPNREADAARANLNPAVSHLRRWLGGGERRPPAESCVLLANGVYRLNPDWQWSVPRTNPRRHSLLPLSSFRVHPYWPWLQTTAFGRFTTEC